MKYQVKIMLNRAAPNDPWFSFDVTADSMPDLAARISDALGVLRPGAEVMEIKAVARTS